MNNDHDAGAVKDWAQVPAEVPENPKLEQFLKKIRANGARDKCPICDTTDWNVLLGIQGIAPSIPFLQYESLDWKNDSDALNTVSLREKDILSAIPTITFICKGCGFIRQHVAEFDSIYVVDKNSRIGDGHHKYGAK